MTEERFKEVLHRLDVARETMRAALIEMASAAAAADRAISDFKTAVREAEDKKH